MESAAAHPANSNEAISVQRCDGGSICITHACAHDASARQVILTRQQAIKVALEILNLATDLIQPYPLIIADVSIDAPDSPDDHATLYIELSGRSVPVLVNLQQVADAANAALLAAIEAGQEQP